MNDILLFFLVLFVLVAIAWGLINFVRLIAIIVSEVKDRWEAAKPHDYGQANKVNTTPVPVPAQVPVPTKEQETAKPALQQDSAFTALLKQIPRAEISLSSSQKLLLTVSSMTYPRFNNITKQTSINNLKDFVVIDVETVSIAARGKTIIELSAIKFKDFYPVECFTTLINPLRKIPAEATAINGITDDMVKNAPKFSEVADSFRDFVGALPIVGHNLEFDLKHIYVNGLDLCNNKVYYDTLMLAKKVLKVPNYKDDDDYEYDIENYKLKTIFNYYSHGFDEAHRSLADCFATGIVFIELARERAGEKVDRRICNNILRRVTTL